MGVNKTSDITSVGDDVLGTAQSTETGLVTAQLGNVVTENAHSNYAEWYFPPGLVSRVRVPDPKKKAAQIVRIRRGSNDAIVGCRDERASLAVDDGETRLFASASGGADLLLDKNGGATLTSGDIKMGDANAQALTFAQQFEALRQAVITIAGTPAVNTKPPMDAATIAKLTSDTANNATTKLKGT